MIEQAKAVAQRLRVLPCNPIEAKAADTLDGLVAEVERLSRWKSTNAPRIESLEGLLAHAQEEAAAGKEAVTSLASEREANAILTAEVERLKALQSKPTCKECDKWRKDKADNHEWIEGVKRGKEIVASMAAKREHITDGTPCWCNPELDYVDPITGAEVWVHKEPQ